MMIENDETTRVAGLTIGDKVVTWINIHSTYQILKRLENSSFHAAAIYNELDLSMINLMSSKDEKIHYIKLEEKLATFNKVIIFPTKKDFLYPTMKWKIKQLIEAGFFDYWMKHYITHSSVVQEEEEVETRIVLTWDHLYVGFTLWMAMLLIAALSFIGEHIKAHILSFLQTRLLEN